MDEPGAMEKGHERPSSEWDTAIVLSNPQQPGLPAMGLYEIGPSRVSHALGKGIWDPFFWWTTGQILREGALMSSAVGLLLSLPGPKETSKAIVTWMTLA